MPTPAASLTPAHAARSRHSAPRRRVLARGLLVLLVLATTGPAGAQTFCDGRTNSGALRGGRELQHKPYLRVKSGSEARAFGHPLLLQLVSRGARAAARAVPGSVALVGDLSGPTGGPLSGHVSHQAGRDADVAFFVVGDDGAPVALDRFEAFDAMGRSLSRPDHVFDSYRNWLLLREWLTELRVVVTHVFVSAELRLLLLDYARQSPEFYRYAPLASTVLRAHPTHRDHFHLRIACPPDQDAGCIDAEVEP